MISINNNVQLIILTVARIITKLGLVGRFPTLMF